MRVLVVNAFPVLPLTHGGRVRTMGLASGLVRAGATVHLLCPWGPGMPWRPFVHDGVTCVPHRFVANALRLVPDRILPPLAAQSMQPFALGPKRRLSQVAGYDVVQFEFCAYASWMERIRHTAHVAYSAHNVEQDQHRGESRDAPLVRPWARRVAALERRAVAASDVVVTCTDRDAQRLSALYGREDGFVVIPNGVDDRLLHSERATLREHARSTLGIPPDALTLLFVGGRARHNEDAVRFLEAAVLPRIGDGALLLVVGACADDLPPASDASVLRLGYVDDLRPVLAAADVAVNPVAYGSGSNLKMGEYLAAGLPVVTTPVGARGFEQHADRLRVAELDQFTDAVLEVAGVPNRESHPAASVQELAWSRLGRRLAATYRSRLKRVPPHTPAVGR